MKQLNECGLDVKKLSDLAQDGCSVMTGERNGVSVQLHKQSRPLLNVHCICHRLALACCDANNWGVHTRHFKCTWSVFEVHLKRTCVWTDRNGSCCTWLIVLSRHGNLKTSKSRSALSSMVSTLLESALIQWKHRKLITNLSVTWSDQFHSRAREQNFVVDYRELWRFINSHRRMISST